MKKVKDKLLAVFRNKAFRKIIRYGAYILLYLLVEFILLGYDRKLIALILPLLLFWTPWRYCVFHLDLLLKSLIVNSINYVRYKEYNYPPGLGTISGYVAHTNKVFGCCKTLSAVYEVYKLYQKYNGADTYDYRSASPHWIKWKVRVISNLQIEGIPVIPFKNLDQLVKLSDEDCHDVYTIVLIDECNAVFNSRNFKNNFQNEEQIKALVTCRHNNMQMILVGQRYKYLDALVRNIMDNVYECVHLPLINTVVHHVYSAYDLETVDNPRLIRRLALKCTYIYSYVYKLYDTKALVSLISKEPGLSSDQVLARRQRSGSVLDARNLTRKGKKMIKG